MIAALAHYRDAAEARYNRITHHDGPFEVFAAWLEWRQATDDWYRAVMSTLV